MYLALREISRAKLRFGLLAGAVALLIFLILFQQTLLGTLVGYFTGALENQSGEVVVYNQDARRNLAGSRITPELDEAVRAVEGIEAIGPLGQGTFTATTADGDEVDVAVWGYELDGPGEPTRLVEGRLPESDFEAVASSVDAPAGFDIGAEVTLVGEEHTIVVVGLAADSRFSVQPTLFTSYATWETLTTADNPDAPVVLASVLLAQPAEATSPTQLANDITAAVDGVEALDRDEAVASLPGVAAVSQSFALILLLSYVVVTLVIGFFFLILTVQKLPAIGLLKALGYRTSTLIGAQLIQIILVTGVGLVIAAAMLMGAAAASGDSFPISAEPGLIITTAAVILVLALVASIAPLRRIAKVEATDTITRANLGGLE